MGFEATARNVMEGRGDRTALDVAGQTFTYRQLTRLTSRFANMLKNFGVQRRQVVLLALPAWPDLWIGALGTLRWGAVPLVLPRSIDTRRFAEIAARTEARLMLTDPEFKERVADPVRGSLLDLWQYVIVNREKRPVKLRAGDFLFEDYFLPAEEKLDQPITRGADPALAALAGDDVGICSHNLTLYLYADGQAHSTAGPDDPDFISHGVVMPMLMGGTAGAPVATSSRLIPQIPAYLGPAWETKTEGAVLLRRTATFPLLRYAGNDERTRRELSSEWFDTTL